MEKAAHSTPANVLSHLLNFWVNILFIPQIVLSGDAFAPAVAYISGNRSDGLSFDQAA